MFADPRAAYVQACMSYAAAERERLEEEILRRQKRLAQLSSELRAVSRELHTSRKRLRVVEAMAATEREQFARDFVALRSLPGVRDVEIRGRCVRVLTEPIVIEHEGERYRIGEFALELDLEQGLRLANLSNTGPRSAWEHPHVQAGLPCLGNLREGFEKLLGECQLVPLVSMLLQFLESYTPDTAYCPIDVWAREEP